MFREARLFYLIFMLLQQWYYHCDEVIIWRTLYFGKCILAIIIYINPYSYHQYGIWHKCVWLTSVCPPVLSCTRLRDIEAVTTNVWKNELTKLQSPSAMSSYRHMKCTMTSCDLLQDHKNIKTVVCTVKDFDYAICNPILHNVHDIHYHLIFKNRYEYFLFNKDKLILIKNICSVTKLYFK